MTKRKVKAWFVFKKIGKSKLEELDTKKKIAYRFFL
jgi:hypothetical protein